ncbi:Tfp pilus assembly protein FimT/FimU [Thalassotalea euphylliae]|uniref:pilus assembly FimT family protein n=1 Tax=Thalassotalea euphylliae TaxID=1655234 RepID=UPI0036420741
MSLVSKRQTGFTLVELIVVMAIVGTLLSFVGPVTVNAMEKFEARQEMEQLKNWLMKLSSKSYATGTSNLVVFEGKKISVFERKNKDGIASDTKTLEYLFFPTQSVSFTSKGFVTTDKLNVLVGSNDNVIDLNLLINQPK